MDSSRIHTPFLRAHIVVLFAGLGLTLLLAGATARPLSAAPKDARTGASKTDRASSPDTPCLPDWVLWPNPYTAYSREQLLGVTAVSPSDAWAVGTHLESPYRPIIQHWTGGSWTDTPGPDLEGAAALWAVAAVSANDVWAVGYYDAGNRRWRPLALHWDGTIWTQVPAPNPGTGSSYLFGVTALAANDVWAVGSSCCVDYDTRTLTVHWDGSTWQVVPSPNVDGMNNTLYAIDALAPNDAWAVGAYGAYDNRQTLVAHWDGSVWSLSGTSRPGALNGIVAVSATEAWAVGYGGPNALRQTLILRYDGSGWEVAPSPSPGNQDNALHDIAMVAADDIWAVGSYRNYSKYGYAWDETLIVHWDGGRWQVVPSPNVPYGANVLYGIAVASPSEMWAVGESREYGYWTRLIARYTGPVYYQDVWYGDYFYEPVRYLTCQGAISGYADNTFRPYNFTTRAQLAKIVVLAEAWPLDTAGGPHFNDVPTANPFYAYVETMYNRGIISGYGCGGAGEPCPGLYFRPNGNITRAQLAKVIVLAEGWELVSPPSPSFTDVPPTSPFYRFVETAASREIIAGYHCGNPEPCDPQGRPYFRPASPAIRGQISKIVYNAVTAP